MSFSFEYWLTITSLLIIHVYCFGMIWFVTGIRQYASEVVGDFKVSIVVAARDEANRIQDLLYDLSIQNFSYYEVIVVDDHSRDGTDRIVQNWCQKDRRFKLISLSENKGKKAALTEGISNSNGEIILTTDADCRVGVDWVSMMVQYFAPDVGFVIGFSQIEKQKTNLRSSFETIDFLGLMACIWGSCGHGYPMAASGQNLAFRKCVYEEVGGYTDIMHRVSGDDVLLMQKVRLLGTWLIAFADSDKARVTHPCSLSWSSLINQRSRWASNAPLMLSVAPFFFVYLTAAYLVNLFLIGLPILYVFGKFELWPIMIMLFAKLLVDWVIFSLITKRIGRCGLKRFWPFWAVLQPLFIVVVGLMGTMGLFRWKHRSQRWGRSV